MTSRRTDQTRRTQRRQFTRQQVTRQRGDPMQSEPNSGDEGWEERRNQRGTNRRQGGNTSRSGNSGGQLRQGTSGGGSSDSRPRQGTSQSVNSGGQPRQGTTQNVNSGGQLQHRTSSSGNSDGQQRQGSSRGSSGGQLRQGNPGLHVTPRNTQTSPELKEGSTESSGVVHVDHSQMLPYPQYPNTAIVGSPHGDSQEKRDDTHGQSGRNVDDENQRRSEVVIPNYSNLNEPQVTKANTNSISPGLTPVPKNAKNDITEASSRKPSFAHKMTPVPGLSVVPQNKWNHSGTQGVTEDPSEMDNSEINSRFVSPRTIKHSVADSNQFTTPVPFDINKFIKSKKKSTSRGHKPNSGERDKSNKGNVNVNPTVTEKKSVNKNITSRKGVIAELGDIRTTASTSSYDSIVREFQQNVAKLGHGTPRTSKNPTEPPKIQETESLGNTYESKTSHKGVTVSGVDNAVVTNEPKDIIVEETKFEAKNKPVVHVADVNHRKQPKAQNISSVTTKNRDSSSNVDDQSIDEIPQFIDTNIQVTSIGGIISKTTSTGQESVRTSEVQTEHETSTSKHKGFEATSLKDYKGNFTETADSTEDKKEVNKDVLRDSLNKQRHNVPPEGRQIVMNKHHSTTVSTPLSTFVDTTKSNRNISVPVNNTMHNQASNRSHHLQPKYDSMDKNDNVHLPSHNDFNNRRNGNSDTVHNSKPRPTDKPLSTDNMDGFSSSYYSNNNKDFRPTPSTYYNSEENYLDEIIDDTIDPYSTGYTYEETIEIYKDVDSKETETQQTPPQGYEDHANNNDQQGTYEAKDSNSPEYLEETSERVRDVDLPGMVKESSSSHKDSKTPEYLDETSKQITDTRLPGVVEQSGSSHKGSKIPEYLDERSKEMTGASPPDMVEESGSSAKGAKIPNYLGETSEEITNEGLQNIGEKSGSFSKGSETGFDGATSTSDVDDGHNDFTEESTSGKTRTNETQRNIEGNITGNVTTDSVSVWPVQGNCILFEFHSFFSLNVMTMMAFWW